MLSILKKALVVLLVLASLVSIVQHWRYTMNLERDTRGTDALDRWEARLALAKESLPVKRGVIGYVAEWDVPGASYGYWDMESEFLLTQYTLAPLILKKGPAAEWNVAILNYKDLAIWRETHPAQYEIIQVEGNVYLFHKLDNP